MYIATIEERSFEGNLYSINAHTYKNILLKPYKIIATKACLLFRIMNSIEELDKCRKKKVTNLLKNFGFFLVTVNIHFEINICHFQIRKPSTHFLNLQFGLIT